MIRHSAFREYYATGQYRGFRKVRHSILKESGLSRITLGNDHKCIEAKGKFAEQALEKAFSAIDTYYRQQAQQRTYSASHGI